MERFNALGRGTQMMLVGGVLLFIVLFFPWQDFDVGGLADEFGVDATFSGWRGVGVILGLLTIVLLAWVIVRLASVDIPLPVSTAMTAALIGTLILIFAVIKILTILGDEATIWSWVGLALAILIAVGAWQTVQEAGGVDTLRSEVPSRTAASTMDAPPPMTSAPPPVVEPEATPHERAPITEPEPSTMSEPDMAPDEPERAGGDEHDHPHDRRDA